MLALEASAAEVDRHLVVLVVFVSTDEGPSPSRLEEAYGVRGRREGCRVQARLRAMATHTHRHTKEADKRV